MTTNWFLRVFEEPDGSPSAARVFSALIICFALGWGTAILKIHHMIPADDVKQLLYCAAGFYGLNKGFTLFSPQGRP